MDKISALIYFRTRPILEMLLVGIAKCSPQLLLLSPVRPHQLMLTILLINQSLWLEGQFKIVFAGDPALLLMTTPVIPQSLIKILQSNIRAENQ